MMRDPLTGEISRATLDARPGIVELYQFKRQVIRFKEWA